MEKTMQLLPNWRAVLQRAWSIRLMILAGLLSGAEIALPLLDGFIDIPRGLFAALSAAATCGAFITRLLAQRGLSEER
jgi:hypothetical protein